MDSTNTLRGNEEKRAYWAGVIQAWKQSGTSQTKYCEENKLSIATFSYWHKQLLKQKNLLVPVKVRESRPLDASAVFWIETPLGVKIFVPSGASASDLETIFKLLAVIK
jgi:hypothetical protein